MDNKMDLDELVKVAHERATPISLASTHHGPRHWRDVARIARTLCTPDGSLTSLFAFALLHDSQRENEYDDPEHGLRAAIVAEDLFESGYLVMSRQEFQELTHALRLHDSGGNDSRPTVAACWDADRLTLPRVGITPEPEYFSMPIVRNHLGSNIAGAMTIVHGPDLKWRDIAVDYRHAKAAIA